MDMILVIWVILIICSFLVGCWWGVKIADFKWLDTCSPNENRVMVFEGREYKAYFMGYQKDWGYNVPGKSTPNTPEGKVVFDTGDGIMVDNGYGKLTKEAYRPDPVIKG